ncbi:MAG TPA: hypothetical protein VK427_23175 [Kofleriaceae bacterium]|nr:hypothetical protein [Kofleriaceae bacterium]
MNRKNLIASFGLATLFALSAGCMVHGSGGAYVSGPSVAVVEVEEEPPPPRVERFHSRPGFIYIQGRWNWHGGRWVWNDGYYERERAGYVYAPGRWERRGRRHVWVDGRWDAHGRGRVEHRSNEPDVRDHRDRDRDRDRRRDDDGPVIRDHR